MNKNNQIEEMAKFVCNACEMGCGFDGECDNGSDYKTCGISVETAEALYTAGYRKTSDIAREIFEEIEAIFNNRIVSYTDMKKQPTLFFMERYAEAMITNCNIYLQDIAELKKKYTEEITEGEE